MPARWNSEVPGVLDWVLFANHVLNAVIALPGHCVLPRRGAPHERMCRYVCGFPTTSPGIAFLSRREAPRAHNLQIKWPFQKGQFNIRFGAIWQHDFGSLREPPFKRSRMINFLCPDIARHIDVQQLSIHIEGCMFKTNA